MAYVAIAKITVKTVCGKFAIPADSIKLMLVAGIASAIKIRTGDNGNYALLVGDFYARSLNSAKPEEFVSRRAILPDSAARAVAAFLEKSKKGSVEFAYFVSAQKSRAMGGVDFQTEAIIAVKASDPLSHLIEGIPNEYMIASGDMMAGGAARKLKPERKKQKPTKEQKVYYKSSSHKVEKEMAGDGRLGLPENDHATASVE
jgi:hypothetical protein